jgi:FixJ family two-component response regulator
VSKQKPLIAVVDDDESVRETTRGLMRSMGFSAEAFASAEDFLGSGYLSRTDCLIADINMPGMSGLDLHRHLALAGKAIPTILITAYPDERVRIRALNAGVRCYLPKPFAESHLLGCLEKALAKRDQEGKS